MSTRSRQPDTARSILYALGANLTIFVTKLAGALYTGSGALLAESLHSLADTANQGLLLVGRKQAKKPPTPHHPLGHGRATYFWSFVVALLLFTLGGVFSIVEGVHKLYASEPIESPWVAVSIVIFAMAAEGISLRVALQQIGKVRGDRTLWEWFRETRRSELIIVLGEDLAAIAGLSLALLALGVTIATGDPLYDAIGSIGIGVLLVIVAIRLAVEIKSLLIGESAAPRTEGAIRALLAQSPDIVELRSLVTMQHGDDLLVAVQARMKPSSGARDLVQSIARCKAALQRKFPQARWVFFEPVDGMEEKSRGPGAEPKQHGRHARLRID